MKTRKKRHIYYRAICVFHDNKTSYVNKKFFKTIN